MDLKGYLSMYLCFLSLYLMKFDIEFVIIKLL